MFGFLKSDRAAAPAKAAPAVIGCFGKLPIRPDFIKYNVAHREVLAVDQWLQEGQLLLNRAYGDAEQPAAPAQYCVFGGSEQERTLLAVLAPSRDRSGRRYPCVLFNLAPQLWLAEQPAALPPLFADFQAAAAQLLAQPWRSEPYSTLVGCIDALHERLPASEPRAAAAVEYQLLGETPLADWRRSLPADVAPAALLHAFIEQLQQVMRRSPQRSAQGLRLPLPQDESQPMLVFWLRLIDGVLGSGQWRPTYFWNDAEAGWPARLTVFFRRPPAGALGYCLRPEYEDESVLDLAQLSRAVTQPSPLAQRLAALEEGNLLDLLRGFGGGGDSR